MQDKRRISRRTMLLILGAVAAIVIGGGAFLRPAKAQTISALLFPPSPCGPVQLHNGDHAIIGVLLPAVQLPLARSFTLVLLDSAGKAVVRAVLPAVQGQPYTPNFVDIYMGDGSVRILRRSTGEVLFSGSSDGALIGLLLPAVQTNGIPVQAVTATTQITDGTTNATTIVRFARM